MSKERHDERERVRKMEAEQRALIRQEAAVEEVSPVLYIHRVHRLGLMSSHILSLMCKA